MVSDTGHTFSPRRILIATNEYGAVASRLRAARPDLEFRGIATADVSADDLEWADTYVGFRRPRPAHMGNVRWVHCTGAGVDGWLFPQPLADDVLLTRTPESFGPRIAEWVLARALAITQQLFPLRFAQQQREWAPCSTVELRGSEVLVVGTGDIGTHVAKLFAACGCKVTGVSRTGDGDARVFATRAKVADLPSLVGTAQWIILTIPLTNASRHLFGRAVMAQCRGAVLINVGRGGVVEETALPEALEKGWLQAAALDVFEVEPLPADSPLWQNPRVIVSPHISGLTTIEGIIDGFIECHAAIERGAATKWLVDRNRGY
jgi:phosphoglycerate dehydrogenase-like enzyme